MLSSRIWLALVSAPIIGAAVYAWLTLATLPASISQGRPTALGLAISAAPAGLIFEVLFVIPIYLALRHWRRLRVIPFIAAGSVAWLLVVFSLMLLVTGNTQVALATAFAAFLPGLISISAFWFIGGAQGGA